MEHEKGSPTPEVQVKTLDAWASLSIRAWPEMLESVEKRNRHFNANCSEARLKIFSRLGGHDRRYA
jgi:hypothetical protein